MRKKKSYKKYIKGYKHVAKMSWLNNIPNRNGRIYSAELVSKLIDGIDKIVPPIIEKYIPGKCFIEMPKLLDFSKTIDMSKFKPIALDNMTSNLNAKFDVIDKDFLKSLVDKVKDIQTGLASVKLDNGAFKSFKILYNGRFYLTAGYKKDEFMILKSPDAITWTQVTVPKSTGFNNSDFRWTDIRVVDDFFIVSGNIPGLIIKSTPDGMTWTIQYITDAYSERFMAFVKDNKVVPNTEHDKTTEIVYPKMTIVKDRRLLR